MILQHIILNIKSKLNWEIFFVLEIKNYFHQLFNEISRPNNRLHAEGYYII